MVGPKKLISFLKVKNLKMSIRGRAFLLLIGALTCIGICFTYILNSTSDEKTDKYANVNEAIVRGYEVPGHGLLGSLDKEFIQNSDLSSIEEHSVLYPLDQNVSQQITKIIAEFGGQSVAHRNNLDIAKLTTVSPLIPTRNIPTTHIPSAHSTVKEKESHDISGQRILSYQKIANHSFGNDVENDEIAESGLDFLARNNETATRTDKYFMRWQNKAKARLQEEQRILEEGKRKLMEEKIRFQQEMNRIMQDLRRGSLIDSQKKFVSRPLKPVDPRHWENLNNSVVDSRYPGIVFLESYRFGRPFVAPDDASAAGMQGRPRGLDDLLDSQAEERFFQLISEIHLDCIVIRRMGSIADGGWDVCTVRPYALGSGCIVYSFGINYDFTFDDAMATSFDCVVKAFDPSMSVGDYVRSAKVHFYQLGLGAQNTVTTNGWKLNTFRHIRKKLGHDKSVIDILKIDIEFYEWECLRNMLNDNSLNNVKQLMFEMHTPEVSMVQRPSTKEDFSNMYGLLLDLEKAGFRRYNVHMNPLGQYTSSRTGKTRSCCFELYYINIRFLKSK